MSNLKILMKNNINLVLGRMQGKRERKSTYVALTLLIVGMLGMFALYTFQAYSMFNGLSKLGLNEVCLFHGFLTGLSVMVIIGIMRVSSNTKGNDTELLLSLPIKKRDIIISKTINRYLFDFFFSCLLIFPYIILYQIFSHFNLGVLLRGILCVLILPLLSVGISYILDFLVTRLFNKLKFGNLLKSLFSVFIFIVVLALMLVKTFFYGTINSADMQAYFSDRFFSNMFLNFVLKPEILTIMGVLIVTLLPFIVGLILYGFNYGKTFSAFSGTTKDLKFNSNKSTFSSLVKKELSTYATTPAWIVNSIIGPIFILVVSILFSSMGLEKISSYLGTPVSKEMLSLIICVAFCGMSSTTIISCCSISLEGKNFWVLKSSPINEKQLLLSKALLQIIMVEPFILLASIILLLCLNLSFFNFLIVFIIPTLLTLILSFAGVLINIFYPVLNFDDETKVVKQSFSTLLTMLLGVVLSALLVGVYYLFNFLPITYIFIISVALYLVILSITLILLFIVGINKIRKIQI